MIDKPVPARIILILADPNHTGETFLSLSATLYNQNLIYSEPQELRRHDCTLELFVTFQDIHSFSNWRKNAQIDQLWSNKFKALLAKEPETVEEIEVVIEVDKVANCSCKQPAFYILQGRYFRYIDELICGSCLGQVPFSRIPLEIEIENWQRHFQRAYLNWLESSFLEKEAYRELTNYKKGKINIEGERIRKQLSDYFKIPVYINYFVEQSDATKGCLICGDRGIDSGIKKLSKICTFCNTIF